jgi:hypothetical protein
VSTFWEYHKNSDLTQQDKDFLRLNKGAITNHATTAHVSIPLLIFFKRGNICTDKKATSG